MHAEMQTYIHAYILKCMHACIHTYMHTIHIYRNDCTALVRASERFCTL
jgi:hypothetical protein